MSLFLRLHHRNFLGGQLRNCSVFLMLWFFADSCETPVYVYVCSHSIKMSLPTDASASI